MNPAAVAELLQLLPGTVRRLSPPCAGSARSSACHAASGLALRCQLVQRVRAVRPPLTVARWVVSCTQAAVLDPFVGSGTTLIEVSGGSPQQMYTVPQHDGPNHLDRGEWGSPQQI